MSFLTLFVILGVLPLLVVGWKVRQTFQNLTKTAQGNEGFAMRKPSLGPTEWRQWNSEYLRWRFFRVVFWLGLGEGLLLALALRKIQQLPALLLYLQLCQLLPFFLIYVLHLWLLFRYGRFNLQRFDPTQEAARQLLILLVATAAWTPIAATWLFFRLF